MLNAGSVNLLTRSLNAKAHLQELKRQYTLQPHSACTFECLHEAANFLLHLPHGFEPRHIRLRQVHLHVAQ